jgi:yecA family protein
MQRSSRTIDQQGLEAQLTVSALSPSAAEAHGILCALLCAGEPGAKESWIAELLAGTDDTDLPTQECRRSLRDLAARTCEEIADTQVGFTPLLAEDSRPLAERALGLYDWSRGFLYGVGLSGMDVGRLSEQAREALDTLTDITRLDLDDLEDSEDNEWALMELTELVRIAAVLVYEEYRGESSP